MRVKANNDAYMRKLLVRWKPNNMTRSYQMHCTCDDLPSSLSYLSNHLWLWKQKWLLGTGRNHLLARDKTQSKQANFYLCHMKAIQKPMKNYISFKHGQNDAKKRYVLYMRFLCVSYAFLMRLYFFHKNYLASKLIYFTRQKVNFTSKKSK